MPTKADSNTIGVGFRSYWDAGGDKQVLTAVEALVGGINQLLKNAVKFEADNKITDRLKAQIKEVAKVADVAVKDINKTVSKLEGSIDSLSKKYLALDGAIDRTGKRGTRTFKDLLAFQVEWYAGTSLLLGSFYAIGAAIREAFDFTQDIRNVGAIVGSTESELRELQEAALDLDRTLTAGAVGAAKALELLGQAGLDTSQSIGALGTVTGLMVATGASAEEAVKSITTAMNVWNYEADQAIDIGNAMAAMLNYSKLEVKDMGVILNYLASTAKQAGWSLEAAGAAAAVMANHGVRASTIGTSLSSAIGSLIAPTKKMKDTFAEFGLSLDDVNPRANSLADIIERMKAAGMDVEDIYKAFNKREARAMVSLINAGAEELRNMEKHLTGTNALLLTVDKSMKGAKNQFSLLANEIQNAFNRALLDSEGGLANMAKGVRALVIGAEDAFPAIAALNGLLLATNTAAAKTAGSTNLLIRAFGFLGGWWGVAAVAGTGLLALLGFLHRSQEQQLKDLEAEANGYLVAIEAVRQRNASLEDYSKKLDENRDSQAGVREIRQKLIEQYPEIVRYLQQEGKETGHTASEYDRLTTAIESYRLAGLRDTKSATVGFFATTSKELSTLRNQIAETEQYFQGLIDYQERARSVAGFSAEPLERYQERIKQIMTEQEAVLNKLRSQQDTYVSDAAGRIYNLLKSGMGGDELKRIIESLFSGDDLKVMLGRLEALSKEVDAIGQKAGGTLKHSEGKVKELVSNIGKDYDDLVSQLKDDYEAMSDAVMVSTKPEEERHKLLVDIERDRIKETLHLLEQEAHEKEVLWMKSEADYEAVISNIHAIETRLSSDRRKLYKEMYGQAKDHAQEALSDIDDVYKRERAGMEEQLKWQEQWFKRQPELTERYTQETTAFYERQAQRMIRADKEVARRKINTLQDMHLSEKDFAEKSEDIMRDSVDNQIDGYGDLRDKLMGVYDELEDKLKELRKESKQLANDAQSEAKAWSDLRNGIFGKTQGIDAIEEQLDGLESQIKKALSSGTEEGYEEAIELTKRARDLMGNIDYEAEAGKPFKSLLDSQIGSWIDDFQKLGEVAQKGLQAINQQAQGEAERGMGSTKDRLAELEARMKSLRDTPVEVQVKFLIDDEAIKRKVEPIDVELRPRLDADAKEKLKQITGDESLTVEPKLDQAGLQQMRGELEQPTTNQHTVNPDTAAAQVAIAALQATTHSWHVVHVKKVYDGGGGDESGSTSEGSEPSPEGFSRGGWLAGFGGGDKVPILAELGEYIARKEAVKLYGRNFFELLNRRAVPPRLIDALAGRGRGSVQKFKEGGSVEPSTSSHSLGVYQVHFRVGDDDVEFPVKITRDSRAVFDQFLDRYQKEKLMRRKR